VREFDKHMHEAYERLSIKPGDIYESCSYHPVLCLGVNYKQDEIWGVSLIDGSYPRSCSLLHCGVRKLSPKQAWQIKMTGPLDAEARETFKLEARWWRSSTLPEFRVGLVGPRPKKGPVRKNGA
jgi:hypothetical protein